ncbi:haloacid dehalogenase-like hydrolase family protein [Gracilaria domingensis]|nr:haloacid dehalogenase-like hydrolase family protein [Gracilaria domingensis]
MKRLPFGYQCKAFWEVSLFEIQSSACKQTHRGAFIPGQLNTLWNSSPKHHNLVCRRPNNIRVPRRRPSSSAPVSRLYPPNKDVDWIFVDTVVKTHVPVVSGKLEREVQDDALSLVRVALRDAPTELCIVLCDDKEISTLNSQWRGIDEATDVLSFPQNDPDMVVLGDIVISVETAVKQAEEREYGVRDEIRVLLVHGLLHLMGYDHEGVMEGDWLVVSSL